MKSDSGQETSRLKQTGLRPALAVSRPAVFVFTLF